MDLGYSGFQNEDSMKVDLRNTRARYEEKPSFLLRPWSFLCFLARDGGEAKLHDNKYNDHGTLRSYIFSLGNGSALFYYNCIFKYPGSQSVRSVEDANTDLPETGTCDPRFSLVREHCSRCSGVVHGILNVISIDIRERKRDVSISTRLSTS